MDYNKLCKMFDNCFPLKADCGVLCDKCCCKGDENTGMLLFPGEETSFTVKTVNGKRLAVCGGECDRSTRPLACRLFPFFPVVDENGKIKAVPDYRGLGICPLVAYADETRFDSRFLRRVKKAGKILYKDRECAAFMDEISKEILEQQKLCHLFKE